ncbi:hypothetical protein BN946_scf185043.g214 [Trametes cinnabarina]|uniref:Uncharacterized protein n=1 Tax=Pycnoporus cinnabarinus TaxID=5643 RepID=A0A060SNY5_PYCCI|nr:hypothetical protein BN946_scf185043.g214 [Trametes cinnabarina]
MTYQDDHQAAFKLQGVRLVSQLLHNAPPNLLRRTGVDVLLSTSLKTCLTFLHDSETPALIRAAVSAHLYLTERTTTEGSAARFEQLCGLLGDGIIGNIWLYAYREPHVIEASLDCIPDVVQLLDIGTARYLKALVPQLVFPLVPAPENGASTNTSWPRHALYLRSYEYARPELTNGGAQYSKLYSSAGLNSLTAMTAMKVAVLLRAPFVCQWLIGPTAETAQLKERLRQSHAVVFLLAQLKRYEAELQSILSLDPTLLGPLLLVPATTVEIGNSAGRSAAAAAALRASNGGDHDPIPTPTNADRLPRPPLRRNAALNEEPGAPPTEHNKLVPTRKFGDMDTSLAKNMSSSIRHSSAAKHAPPGGRAAEAARVPARKQFRAALRR